MIPKPMSFLLYCYNSMITYSIKCAFLLALPATGFPDTTTNKTRQQAHFVLLELSQWGSGMLLWSDDIALSRHLPFTFCSIKNTPEVCSWNNSYISQFFAELVKEKRKFRLELTVPDVSVSKREFLPG